MSSTELQTSTAAAASATRTVPSARQDGRLKVPRIGVFGWGIVAPESPNIDAFARNLEKSESWLTPFEGFGPSNFLVGQPDFRFEDYKPWIDERFAPGTIKI